MTAWPEKDLAAMQLPELVFGVLVVLGYSAIFVCINV